MYVCFYSAHVIVFEDYDDRDGCWSYQEKNLYMDLDKDQLPKIGETVHIRFENEKEYLKRVVTDIQKHYSASGCMLNFILEETRTPEYYWPTKIEDYIV